MTNSKLSLREHQVACLLVKGMSYREIAQHLGISFFTVIQHVHKVFAKTGCENRTVLAVKKWDQFGGSGDNQGQQLLSELTAEQRELLREVLLGRSDKEIAHETCRHRVAVTKQVGKIIKLFKVDSKPRMVYFALANGFQLEGGQS